MGDLLFDRDLLKRNQARFQKQFKDHNFLHHEMAQIMVDNVVSLNRDFDKVLEISAKDDFLANYIKKNLKVKEIITSCLIESDFADIVLDDEEIEYESEQFDLIFSNLNIQHINKIPQFLVKIHSILKKDGVFVASFFGEENLLTLKKATVEAENTIYGKISPRFIPVIDIQTSANLLVKAGFKDPASALESIDVSYENGMNIFKDLKYMGQGNVLKLRDRGLVTQKFLDEILKNYAKIAKSEDSSLDLTYEIITVIGFKK